LRKPCMAFFTSGGGGALIVAVGAGNAVRFCAATAIVGDLPYRRSAVV